MCEDTMAPNYPVSIATIRQRIIDAMNERNRNGESNIRMYLAGTKSSSDDDCRPDVADFHGEGYVVVTTQWRTPCREGSGSYAITAWNQPESDESQLLGAQISVGVWGSLGCTDGTQIPWTFTAPTAGEVDFESVLTHEFGHAFGLGHSTVDSQVLMTGAGLPANTVRHLLAVAWRSPGGAHSEG